MGTIILILTALLSSGFISAGVTFHFAEAKERWLLKRSKIEAIYLDFASWLKATSAYYFPHIGVCQGAFSYNDMLDMQIKNADPEIGMLKLKTKMNIFMYEPTLSPFFERVEAEIKNTNELTAAIRSCYKETGQASQFLGPSRSQLIQLEASGQALLEAIVERGKEIGAERGQVQQVVDRSMILSSALLGKIRRRVSRTDKTPH